MNFVKLPACFVCMISANLHAGHPVNIFCKRAQIPRVRAGQMRTISWIFRITRTRSVKQISQRVKDRELHPIPPGLVAPPPPPLNQLPDQCPPHHASPAVTSQTSSPPQQPMNTVIVHTAIYQNIPLSICKYSHP